MIKMHVDAENYGQTVKNRYVAPRTHARARTHAHARTHARTHAHTHTHTRTTTVNLAVHVSQGLTMWNVSTPR